MLNLEPSTPTFGQLVPAALVLAWCSLLQKPCFSLKASADFWSVLVQNLQVKPLKTYGFFHNRISGFQKCMNVLSILLILL